MDELATILQKTLDLSREVRESAESVIKDHIESEGIYDIFHFCDNLCIRIHINIGTVWFE